MRLHQLPSDGWVVLGPGEPAELVYDGDMDPCPTCESLDFDPSRWRHARVEDPELGVWSGAGPRPDWARPPFRSFTSLVLHLEAYEKLAGRTRAAWTEIEVRSYAGGPSTRGYLLTGVSEALQTVPVGRPFGGWRCPECGNYFVSHVDVKAGTVTHYARESDLPLQNAPFVTGSPRNYRRLVCPHESLVANIDLFGPFDDFAPLVSLREHELGRVEELQPLRT